MLAEKKAVEEIKVHQTKRGHKNTGYTYARINWYAHWKTK